MHVLIFPLPRFRQAVWHVLAVSGPTNVGYTPGCFAYQRDWLPITISAVTAGNAQDIVFGCLHEKVSLRGRHLEVADRWSIHPLQTPWQTRSSWRGGLYVKWLVAACSGISRSIGDWRRSGEIAFFPNRSRLQVRRQQFLAEEDVSPSIHSNDNQDRWSSDPQQNRLWAWAALDVR